MSNNEKIAIIIAAMFAITLDLGGDWYMDKFHGMVADLKGNPITIARR